MAFKYPNIAEEWHPTKNNHLTPWDVSYGSQQVVWWKCKKGHEWMVSIGSRTNRNRKCPYCTHQKVYKETSLAFLNSKLARQWHPIKNGKLTPQNVTSNSTQKVWWFCKKCKSEWKNSVSHRSRQKTCPFCDGKRANNTNSLSSLRPDLLDEWDYKKNIIPPSTYTTKSGKKVWWKCRKCGSSWQASIGERTIGHQKCFRCRSLGAKYPKVLKQMHPSKNKNFNPFSILPGKRKKIWWRCDKGHEYRMALINKVCQGQGCPYCSNKKIDRNNCFATLRPDLLKEWHYKKNKISPYKVSVNSRKRVWWKCKRGHEWVASVSTRNYGHGCPKCFGVVLKDGTHCLSLVEAYFYLKFKKEGKVFLHNKNYPKSRYRYDFYFPNDNVYLEVTRYDFRVCRWWKQYRGKIFKKRRYVEDKLKAKFQFIQKILTPKETTWVKSNTA